MSDLLQAAAIATKGGDIPVAAKADLADLMRDGLIELGPQEKPGSNKFQFRATATGVAAAEAAGTNGSGENTSGENTTNEAPKVVATIKGFEIETGIPLPAKSKRSGPSGKYPFDALEVGQSFFVPATTERAEPWKSLQSTVAAAQRRHATEEGTRTDRNGNTVPNLKPTRIFRLDKDTRNGQDGARIFRTA